MFLNVEKLIENIEIDNGMTVADFGFGSGDLSVALAKLVGETGKVIAIDVLPSAISVLQSKIQQQQIKNIEIVKANLETDNSQKIPSKVCDLIFAINIFFQASNPINIIKEIERVLKNTGKLIIADWKTFSAKFGPIPGKEVDPMKLEQILMINGFVFEKNVDVGEYHWCKVYAKKTV